MKRKNLFYLVSSGVLTVAIAVGLYCFFVTGIYFYRIPVTFGKAGTPYVNATIRGKDYQFLVDLGSKFELTMRQAFLDQVTEKQSHGVVEWKDLQGGKYEAPAYLLSQITLGGLQLNEVVVSQEDDDFLLKTTVWDGENKGKGIVDREQGSIGRALLIKHNLLLDFGNSCMIITNDLDELKHSGYNLSEFIKIPFDIGRMGPILLVDTDLGLKKFSIDTGATLNFIRTSELQDVACMPGNFGICYFKTLRFSIGERDLGEVLLHSYALTNELEEIDGFLGMSFLENHVVYFDFSKKVVYIK